MPRMGCRPLTVTLTMTVAGPVTVTVPVRTGLLEVGAGGFGRSATSRCRRRWYWPDRDAWRLERPRGVGVGLVRCLDLGAGVDQDSGEQGDADQHDEADQDSDRAAVVRGLRRRRRSDGLRRAAGRERISCRVPCWVERAGGASCRRLGPGSPRTPMSDRSTVHQTLTRDRRAGPGRAAKPEVSTVTSDVRAVQVVAGQRVLRRCSWRSALRAASRSGRGRRHGRRCRRRR